MRFESNKRKREPSKTRVLEQTEREIWTECRMKFESKERDLNQTNDEKQKKREGKLN